MTRLKRMDFLPDHWRVVGQKRNGHVVVENDKGRRTQIAFSPSGGKRTRMNTLARLRRIDRES